MRGRIPIWAWMLLTLVLGLLAFQVNRVLQFDRHKAWMNERSAEYQAELPVFGKQMPAGRASGEWKGYPTKPAQQPAPAMTPPAAPGGLRWIRLAAHQLENSQAGSGAPASPTPPQRVQVLGGNFDADPDSECIVFTLGSDVHWLVEASGVHHELAFPCGAQGGNQALDIDGDGVDELIPSVLDWFGAGGAAGADTQPAFDVHGKPVGKAPWASTAADPLIAADFDGKPGLELLRMTDGQPSICRINGSPLLEIQKKYGRMQGGFPIPMHSPLVAADITGDGLPEFFYEALTNNMPLVAYADIHGHRGTLPIECGAFTLQLTAAADLDGDAKAELLGMGFIYNPGQQARHDFLFRTGGISWKVLPWEMNSPLLAGDFDHDGSGEVATALPAQQSHLQPDYPEGGSSGRDNAAGSTVPGGLWRFGVDGMLIHVDPLPIDPPVAGCVLHAGGKDYLALAVGGKLWLSQ